LVTGYNKAAPLLAKNGSIYLPHNAATHTCIEDNETSNIIKQYFVINKEFDCLQNPLFLATETAEDQLLKSPEPITNANQLKILTDFSPNPFYKLTRIF
jgi:hypothetical protein